MATIETKRSNRCALEKMPIRQRQVASPKYVRMSMQHSSQATAMLREFKFPILYIKVRLGTCILTAYAPMDDQRFSTQLAITYISSTGIRSRDSRHAVRVATLVATIAPLLSGFFFFTSVSPRLALQVIYPIVPPSHLTCLPQFLNPKFGGLKIRSQ